MIEARNHDELSTTPPSANMGMFDSFESSVAIGDSHLADDLDLDLSKATLSRAMPFTDNVGSIQHPFVCSRLPPPPPVPPWLLDSSEKLRDVMANCSSWQKYTSKLFNYNDLFSKYDAC